MEATVRMSLDSPNYGTLDRFWPPAVLAQWQQLRDQLWQVHQTFWQMNSGDVQGVFDQISGSVDGTGIKYFHANSKQADSQAIGVDSVAIGPVALAAGVGSVAEGLGSTAWNDNSIAIGNGAVAGISGDPTRISTIAIGNQATASAQNSMAIGDGSKASGPQATAIGSNAKATAAQSPPSPCRATGNLPPASVRAANRKTMTPPSASGTSSPAQSWPASSGPSRRP